MLTAVMRNVVILSVIMLSVIIMSVMMLNVVTNSATGTERDETTKS